MGILSGIGDFLLGSKGKIDWDELRKMVELQADVNRTDRNGVFTGWEWDRDAEGNPLDTQRQTINPAFQGAVDRLGFNAGKPEDPYTSPSQFSQMLDAKMKNQMDRQGLNTSGYQQQNPGQFPPSADRQGRFAQAYMPQAPQEQPPTAQLPPPPGYTPIGGGQPGGPGGKAPIGSGRPHALYGGGI
jgi:hypothetical protein